MTRSSIVKTTKENLRNDERVAAYRTNTKESWKRYLDASKEADKAYDRTMKSIHKDPKFEQDVENLKKEALDEGFTKGTRGYQKMIEYGTAALEERHPLYKDYETSAALESKYGKEARASSKKLAKELLGGYGKTRVANLNEREATNRSIVEDAINELMISDYYDDHKD